MVDLEQVVMVTDAVLNCIPIVNTINSAAQALYKLAYRVDALNPVAPGLKTAIEFHILNKSSFDYSIDAIPIIGNLVALTKLILFTFCEVRDNLVDAIFQNDEELVRLYLANNTLSDDLDRAQDILTLAATDSSNKIFKYVLNHRQDWKDASLQNSLQFCLQEDGSCLKKASKILDYWDVNNNAFTIDYGIGVHAMQSFLANNRADLAERIIPILPYDLPLEHMRHILFRRELNKNNSLKEEAFLPQEQIHALIAKCKQPSRQQIELCYRTIAYQLAKSSSPSPADSKALIDTLETLLDKANLPPDEIAEFICTTIKWGTFIFIEFLFTKYDKELSPELKVKILSSLTPSAAQISPLSGTRTLLFAEWVDKWKSDIPQLAPTLYTNISIRSDESERESQQNPSAMSNLREINREFKRALLETFPKCDQAPSVKTA